MNSIVIPVTEQYKDRFTVENGSLVLQKVQPNDTGRYHLKFHDTKSTEEIELTVTAVTKSVTPDPLAGSFPTTVEPGQNLSLAIGVGVPVAVILIVLIVLYMKRKAGSSVVTQYPHQPVPTAETGVYDVPPSQYAAAEEEALLDTVPESNVTNGCPL
ncbi:uncharacterized protein LOC106707111 [Latimeria chalumnae]|uniref:uncharacterized protein LOC106707111 n=1 Tax=Latimeria chalumnae TaxID=7897 RepID=UPI0006D8F4A0|nr:PREDICTED: uncharacterized protein LOC106707111 isoform X1 [Latimeria chalumnae]XP_014354433.1 PREDICTED: uncharacterized protein LOC106707111 isoform X1 [Latimeria chalumnae]|eukprot:XP_014354431.1 PREDICTED: uncharacterized protein LOC106707111 isoform X1 [Latimeria chalumnae]